MKENLKYGSERQNAAELLAELLNESDAIVIGAGAGLSASAGFTYSGERFYANFADFAQKYGFRDMYSGGFYPFGSNEEFWAYWSRYIYINRYDQPAGKPCEDLLAAVKDKNYFVITTNVDHRFQVAGFDKRRLFYTQGDYGLFQCSVPCHDRTYDNEAAIRAMIAAQKDMKIPSELIPRCPVCGADDSQSAFGRQVCGGRRLARRLRKIRGVSERLRGQKDFISRTRRGIEHAGDNQISVLESRARQRQRKIRQRRCFSGAGAVRSARQDVLYRRRYRRGARARPPDIAASRRQKRRLTGLTVFLRTARIFVRT